MENKQYDYENLNQKDMFQDYIDSLPDEEEGKEETGQEYSGLSEQVEKDLLDYKRRGYDKLNKTSSSRSRRSRRRTRSPALAALLITAGAALIITGTAVTVFSNTRDYYEPDYEVEPYEYEDPWADAYSQMSGSLADPEAVVDGYYVSLPVKVSDFMQGEWKISTSAFNDGQNTVGATPQTFQVETEWGTDVAEISVVSPTGEEVALEDGLITGISFDQDGVWVELNGGISTGSGTWSIEEALKGQKLDWIKRGNEEGSRYIIETGADNEYGYDEYVLRLELQDDYIDRIVMQMDQSE